MSALTHFDEQRLAADPAASVWVSANAGSGKTKVLVDRVMRILLTGTPPDRILALTYTRSAAAEMANRLSAMLGLWATAPEAELAALLAGLLGRAADANEMKRARQLFARALDSPGGLKIRTIHGFCQSLLARFPLEAEIAPHFRVIEGVEQSDRLDAARDTELARLHQLDDPAARGILDRLMAEVEETRFGPLIGELISGRGRARLGEPLGQVLARLYRQLGLGDGDTRESLLAVACADASFDAAALSRAAAALRQGAAGDRLRAEALTTWLANNPAARIGRFETDYAGIFLTQKGEVTKRLASKGAIAAYAAVVEVLQAEAERIVAARQRLAAADLALLTGNICGLARALLEGYERRKREGALLDYDDLIARTVSLLQRPGVAPWVLYKLDGGIDHILVDEAQDTAPDQWRIVAALAEEFFTGASARGTDRTIFAVGDEKQSIYGFQGAVPAEFGRFKQVFQDRALAAGRTFAPVALGVSFRSAPAILDAVDATFAGAAAQRAVAAGGAWVPHRPHRRDAHGRVELWPTVVPAEAEGQPDAWDAPLDRVAADDPRARLATCIAGQIHDWIAGGEVLSETKRAIAPQDILILVRRRNAFVEELVRRLKSAGIPVAGADRMRLLEQIAVKDLLAAIGVAILPEDDLTLAAVLRSPLIGLSETALFELAHDRKGERLWRALVRRQHEPAFAAAHGRIAAWLAAADLLPPFEFLSRILEAEGGRHALAARLGPESGDPIDELLALALAYERTEPPSLQGFHHWITTHDAEVKRDLEQGGDAVRIMTVHGAKGLEAPIVILPDTCQPPDHQQDPRVLWLDDETPTPVWVANSGLHVPVTLAARDAHRARQREEYLRLLYVGMTRAQDRLYVTGYETSRGRGEGCWYDLIADALRPMAQEVELPGLGTVLRYDSGKPPVPQGQAAATKSAPPPLPLWATTPAPAEPTPPRPLAPSRPDGDEAPVLPPFAETRQRFRRGLLIHRLLQSLPDLGAEARPAAAAAFLAHAAPELNAATRAALANECLALFDLPEAALLFGPASRAEVPITGRVGDVVVAGQVDRIAVTDTVVHLVDFKTNRPPPARVEDMPAMYRRQMSLYAAILRQIFPDRAVEASILWTDGPRLMNLPPHMLENTAP